MSGKRKGFETEEFHLFARNAPGLENALGSLKSTTLTLMFLLGTFGLGSS